MLRGAAAWAAEPPGAEPAPPAAARSSDAAALDPAGLLLFSVTLDNLTLTEALGAYGEVEDPLLPVGELSRLLEADIDVMPPEQRIVGRLGETRRSLAVDLRAGVARLAGREVAIAPDDYAVTPTEIYLKASRLGALFAMKTEVAPEELLIRLKPDERFPVQARLQRLANRPDGASVGAGEDQVLTVLQPYALFTPPAFDVVLDAGVESGARGRTGRYDVRAAGDLFYSNFQGFLSSDEEGRPANARIMLQRRSLEGALLGPLHAREVTAGDTFSPGLALGPRSVSGRGVSLSTVPLEATNIFNRVDLRGELPPGFDVELYVNDVLKSSTNQAVNGRYEFLDVPLSPGVNIIRTVTYGPRGERVEDLQVVNVGAGLLRPGEATFVFGAIQQDKPLISFRRGVPPIFQPGLFGDDGLRVVGSVNYGLARNLTVTAGAARVPRFGEDDTTLLNAGARTSLFGLATQLDGAWDDDGGSAAAVGLAGEHRGISGVLRHAEYRGGFLDENNIAAVTGLRLNRRTELIADASLQLRGRILPVSIRAIRNDYAQGSYDVSAAWRASTSLANVLLSAGFEYQRQAYRPARTLDTLTGYVAASTFRTFNWQVRATLDYRIVPDFEADYLSVTVDRRLTDRWSLRFALGQPLDDFDDWNVVLASIYATRYGDLSLTGEYDHSDEDVRLAAQWSFGLGYNPARGRYALTRTGPASGGSVLFDAYIDENGDGVRQPQERAAQGVGLDGVGQSRLATDADGRVFAAGLGPGPRARLDVNLDQAEGGSLQTPPPRLDLRPRPGGVARVNFPMRPTGEVMVRIELLRDDGGKVGLSSVRLQLAPQDAGPPAHGVTEFDGSVIFNALPLGTYRLRLDPGQAARLRMRLLDEPVVTIKGDGAFNPDVVARVRFDPPPQATGAPAGDG